MENNEFFRICKICSGKVYHKNKKQLKVATNKNSACFSCTRKDVMNRPEERKKNSERQKGKFLGRDNPNYGNHLSEDKKNSISQKLKGRSSTGMKGKSLYSLWVEKYGVEEADIRMEELSSKRSKNSIGSNNSMYNKPVPKKSGKGASGYYKGFFFRSILELSYIINILERFNLDWKSAEKDEFKIKYEDYLGNPRTYVADFIVNNKYLIECKPKSLINTPLVGLKKRAAEKFCKDNNLIYKIVSPRRLEQKEIDILTTKGDLFFL
jgi:hypothetical protein